MTRIDGGSSVSSAASSHSTAAATSAHARLKAIHARPPCDQRKSASVPNQPGNGAKIHAPTTASAAKKAGRERDQQKQGNGFDGRRLADVAPLHGTEIRGLAAAHRGGRGQRRPEKIHE